VYYYDGEQPTHDKDLGLILPGKNDWTGMHPEAKASAEAKVKRGMLRKG
jgi:hypothetical protein